MKILIVKTSALGDIIHAFPLLGYLKKLHPQATIDWVVEAPFADLVRAHPDVTRTLTVDTKEWRNHCFSGAIWKQIYTFYSQLRQIHYDVVFDLQGNIKSALVTGAARAPVKVGFGYKGVAEWPNLLVTNRKYVPPLGENIRMDYLYLAQRYFGNDHTIQEVSAPIQLTIVHEEERAIEKLLDHPQLHGKNLILVCPGSAWKNKQMTCKDLLQLLLRIVEGERNVVFLLAWGNDNENDYCCYLCEHLPENSLVIERFSITALQSLMGKVDQVIAMDSLPLHLAGTTQTPTWSIFGPSSAKKYAPIGVQHQFYQGTCPYERQFEKRCPVLRSCPTGACIRNLDIDAVITHLERGKI